MAAAVLLLVLLLLLVVVVTVFVGRVVIAEVTTTQGRRRGAALSCKDDKYILNKDEINVSRNIRDRQNIYLRVPDISCSSLLFLLGKQHEHLSMSRLSLLLLWLREALEWLVVLLLRGKLLWLFIM